MTYTQLPPTQYAPLPPQPERKTPTWVAAVAGAVALVAAAGVGIGAFLLTGVGKHHEPAAAAPQPVVNVSAPPVVNVNVPAPTNTTTVTVKPVPVNNPFREQRYLDALESAVGYKFTKPGSVLYHGHMAAGLLNAGYSHGAATAAIINDGVPADLAVLEVTHAYIYLT